MAMGVGGARFSVDPSGVVTDAAQRYRDIMWKYGGPGASAAANQAGAVAEPGMEAAAPGIWQTLRGQGPGGSGFLGRLGYPAAEEGASIGLKGTLMKAAAYPIAGYYGGTEFGKAMGATDPLATQAHPGVLGTTSNIDAPGFQPLGQAKTATGDIGKNMMIGAGLGAAAGSIVPVLGTAAGAAVGAGIGGIGTAINDIWGQGKAGPDAPAAAAAPPPKPPSTAGDLAGLMSRVGLPSDLHQRVLDGYRDQLEYYKSLGSAPDPTDPEGKKMTTDPAMMERAAFTQAVQMIPMLKQQSAEESASHAAAEKQHSDYIRRATLLQGALAQIAPQLLTPSNYLVPGEYNQASNSLQAIPAMLAMGEAADQQKQYASALQQASVARTMAALPQSQADDYQSRLQSGQITLRLKTEHPELFQQQQSTDTSATDAINASK